MIAKTASRFVRELKKLPLGSSFRKQIVQGRTFWVRLPKNLEMNRFWIFWGGGLYLAGRMHQRSAVTASPPVPNATVPSLKIYLYWIDWLTRKSTSEPEEMGILLPGLGRLGNAAKRISNAMAAASLLGFRHVIVPEQAIFRPSIFRSGRHILRHVILWIGKDYGPNRSNVRLIGSSDFLGTISGSESLPEETRNAIWPDLGSCLTGGGTVAPFPTTNITIHLRGGDVFGRRKPASYGQPPLGFYTKILTNGKWRSVVIVHQDLSNPVLPELLRVCDELGLAVQTLSGELREDVEALLRARTLVVARGSFGPAIVGLSNNIEDVYYFEDKFSLAFRAQKVRVHRVIDSTGVFRSEVLSDNWEGAPHQYELMLTYDSENLSITQE